ncbi:MULTISPECIES: phospholipase D-like domain-containing protein [Sphingobacterium]|uniref:phospholipase D-like domain-containing protein n=1 Tax=Sphingobacterium TaxID=28453 RepID=UPI002580994C|nr:MULTISPECIES: phospholipase D-like domain-containing protein [Sphingobacterium]
MIQLISNILDKNHFDLINKLMSESDEAFIMIAFLKSSGLRLIEPKLKQLSNVQILAGANFGLTEPAALKQILKLSTERGNISGYINKLSSKEIFHPKMYLFRSGSCGHIIVGSANLTGGGLEGNNECSLYTECKVSDNVWKDSKEYFDRCIHLDNADPLNDRIIGLYSGYYNKQRSANKSIDEFPDISDSLIYDFEKLKFLYNSFDQNEIRKGIKEKKRHYAEALVVLNEIESVHHSDIKFKQLLEDLVGRPGQHGLWYSNGMFRHKTKIFKQQKGFRELINFIKTNLDKTPAFVYQGARERINSLQGVGPNFVGEIMMTYAPNKFANINRNPITVLIEEGCVGLKDHSQKFNGSDYEEYNNIVMDIVEKLDLKSMLAADYFFNNIYQNLKAKGKLR